MGQSISLLGHHRLVSDSTSLSAGLPLKWAGLKIIELNNGCEIELNTNTHEALILALAGEFKVASSKLEFNFSRNRGIFGEASEVLYLPCNSSAIISTNNSARLAIAFAPNSSQGKIQFLPKDQIEIELRGSDSMSRQINFLSFPQNIVAERLLVCEVLTPGGNWSSFPPHKHDESTDSESKLEEIYYFEVESKFNNDVKDKTDNDKLNSQQAGLANERESESTKSQNSQYGLQRVYASDSREIDVFAEVRTGDMIGVPFGWHGPSIAMPYSNLYYLNVMAGENERMWRVSFDPCYCSMSEGWQKGIKDPRLPYYGGSAK